MVGPEAGGEAGSLKILITGGGGFIGSHLSEELLERGYEVFVLEPGGTTKVRHLIGHPRFRVVRDSVMDVSILDSLIAQVDIVFHLAAVVGVEHYVGDPYQVLNVNVNGTQNVLKAAFKYGRKVVFSSTSEVYGRNPNLPWAEDDDRVLGSTRIDRWCYSTSKAVGEHFCFAYHRLGLPVTILRYFNIFGPRLDKLDAGRIITIFMGQLLRGEPLTVIGDGKQTRCFTYVSDAVKATANAGLQDNTNGEIYNIGTDVETSILDLAKKMIEISGSSSEIRFVGQEEVYGDSYEDIGRRVPDATRMKEVLGVRDLSSLEDGLRRTIDWFRSEAQ
jgi:UDP-glucose 4-epimerase